METRDSFVVTAFVVFNSGFPQGVFQTQKVAESFAAIHFPNSPEVEIEEIKLSPAPSPQPSAEATEPTAMSRSMQKRIASLKGEPYPTFGPAPSGETRGTCETVFPDRENPQQHRKHFNGVPHMKIEGLCVNWKPLAPEATTKEIDPRYTFVAGNAAPNIVFDSEAKEPDVPHCFKCEHNHFGACKAAPGEAVGRETREQEADLAGEFGFKEYPVAGAWHVQLNGEADDASVCQGDPNAQETLAVALMVDEDDAPFIAAAPNIFAALVKARSELSTLRRERDQLKETLDLAVEDTNELDKEVEKLESQVRELTGAMKAQDEREAKAGELCGVSRELHGCDWPDAVAERVRELTARNEDLAESVDRHRTRAQHLADQVAELRAAVEKLTNGTHEALLAKAEAEEKATIINSELFEAKKQISKAENLYNHLYERTMLLERELSDMRKGSL